MNLRMAFLALCAIATTPAATISVTYTNSITATGDPTNPPLIGNGTGAVLPLGNMTWMDMAFPNLETGAITGIFTMTFANGSLFGNLAEQADLTAPPTAVPITQRITVLGGTGSLLWYNGVITSSGIVNLVADVPTAYSGGGTLNTTPEPGSFALLPFGLAGIYLIRRRVNSTG